MTVTRRQFLSSTVAAGGAGLSLGQVLRLQAANKIKSTNDTAIIQIWLGGGPSQFETFDPKPQASVDIRGPYGTVGTAHPGIRFCETMPLTGKVIDQATLIRSVAHSTNGHFIAAHWLSTGYAGTNNVASHPSTGAITSHFCGPNQPGMPAYVLLSEEQTRNPNIGEVMGTGHLGSGTAPFTVLQDPFRSPFGHEKLTAAVSNLQLADNVTLDRMSDRRTLLSHLDRIQRNRDSARTIARMDAFNDVAFDIVTSGKARQAFDLSQESEATRQLYGAHRWGQSALLARRLVESGVSFVTINTAPDSLCWDWHLNIVNDDRPTDGSEGPSRGMDISGPPLDQMLHALITDLADRGLDKKVLVVVWGEFGRTPRINKTGGRDHWGALMSMLLVGGGLKMGQVIGASNGNGEMPIDRPVHPEDVLATMYRHLGINLNAHTVNREGRPIPLLPGGEAISELL